MAGAYARAYGPGQTSATTDSGWECLRAGQWRLARERFAAAPGSPEALEGLSWAAWWLDDAAAVFSAREQAFALYRERGDPVGAARMAIWIGADEHDFHGAAAVAAGWFERARRLLAPLRECAEHGWLAFHEGYLAGRGADGVRAAAIGRRLGVPDLEMLGLALEGSALVAAADVERGRARLAEAAVIALEGRAEIPISCAWTCCFVVSACLAVHDIERAYEWTDRVAEFAERHGSRWMLAFCRAEYGTVYLWRGRWDDADALFSAAIDDYTRSRPAWTAGPLAGLAELRRRQGRTAEALALLERAGPTRAAELCRARITRDAALAERLLRRTGRPLDRAPILALLIELGEGGDAPPGEGRGDRPVGAPGEGRRGEPAVGPSGEPWRAGPGERGEAWRAELARLAAAADTPALRALADLAEGRARGDRALLEDAVDGFAGAPYEQAQARLALAERFGDARERRAAAAQLNALGAATPLPELSRREREVLALLADGLTNRELAHRLVVSEHTVHRHVTNILTKLRVPTRAAAAALAVKHGLR